MACYAELLCQRAHQAFKATNSDVNPLMAAVASRAKLIEIGDKGMGLAEVPPMASRKASQTPEAILEEACNLMTDEDVGTFFGVAFTRSGDRQEAVSILKAFGAETEKVLQQVDDVQEAKKRQEEDAKAAARNKKEAEAHKRKEEEKLEAVAYNAGFIKPDTFNRFPGRDGIGNVRQYKKHQRKTYGA